MLTCHACGAALHRELADVLDPQTREHFALWRCPTCGLGHTHPQPVDIARYYGATYHGGRHGPTGPLALRRRLRFLRSSAGAAQGRQLVDVGCGDGAFLVAARDAGWQVAGTELNTGLARQRGLRVEAELRELKELAPFDTVTLWHSLEHMPDPRSLLEDVAQMTVPGGVLLVAVPNAGGAQARLFREHWLHVDAPRHLYHFTETSLRLMLQTSGFTTVRTWPGEAEYDLAGWSQSALNVVAREPNVFLDWVTRRPRRVGRGRLVAHVGGGALLSAVALPVVAARIAVRRGDTLVVAARRMGEGRRVDG